MIAKEEKKTSRSQRHNSSASRSILVATLEVEAMVAAVMEELLQVRCGGEQASVGDVWGKVRGGGVLICPPKMLEGMCTKRSPQTIPVCNSILFICDS